MVAGSLRCKIDRTNWVSLAGSIGSTPVLQEYSKIVDAADLFSGISRDLDKELLFVETDVQADK